MRALRQVRDGPDRPTATGAAVAKLDVESFQQFVGDSTHLGETDGAREREAGVAQGLAGGIDEQTTYLDVVSSLLVEGAFAVARAYEAFDRAVQLQRETREVVLTFRSHRFRPIFGSDDLDGGEHVGDQDELRRRLRALAALGTVKTYVGPSRGATCDLCHKPIVGGENEYEIVDAVLEIRLDVSCYDMLVNALSDPRREPDVPA